jgi:hypothetical protein
MAFNLRKLYCHTCGTEQRVGQYLARNKTGFWRGLVRSISASLTSLMPPQPALAGNISEISPPAYRPQTYSARSATLEAPQYKTQTPRVPVRAARQTYLKSERKNTLNLSEFRSLSSEQQDEIIDFVRFRYEARATNPFLRETPLETLITNLSRNIEVPIGGGHKYLSRELIEKIIL